MTALCPAGGPSGTKPNVPMMVTVSAVAIESTIILAGYPTIAAILAPLLASVPFSTAAFCSTDPPADPGLTAQDLLDVVNWADPTVNIPAIDKFKQWWEHYYWYILCE